MNNCFDLLLASIECVDNVVRNYSIRLTFGQRPTILTRATLQRCTIAGCTTLRSSASAWQDMADQKKAARLRAEAKKVMALAAEMTADNDVRFHLMEIAQKYEWLAERVEKASDKA